MENIYLIDKPAGWTSFDVVAKIRGALRANSKRQKTNDSRKIRVGHAGTLDPFATGLLIVLIGSATKKQDDFMKQDKEYEATLRLGATSTTGDPEGQVEEIPNDKLHISNESEVTNILKKYQGEIAQIPPAHSAIKINGKRAYQLARAGEKVELKPRTVTIYEVEIIKYKYPELQIRVKCSSGTYIRTLAEDIGRSLGTGAYLTELRRTKIGKYDINDAQKIEDIVAKL